MYDIIEKMTKKFKVEEEEILEILREFYEESYTWESMSQ